jgi:hypothetical protein
VIYVLDLPKDTPGNPTEAKARIRELAKCCRQVMADGIVSSEEITALRQWIAEAGWLRNYWPAGALGARILDVLDPDNADKKAHQELEKLLGEIASGVTEEDCITDYDKVARIAYKDQYGTPRKFCFTGIFYFGTRDSCWEAVLARGGEIRENVSAQLDYIVVGGVCSPRWVAPGSGTKLNAARALREKYQEWRKLASTKDERDALPRPPRIVSEHDWVRTLPRLVRFRKGRAVGYDMFLPPAFRAALESYDFAAGDIVYDVDPSADEWSTVMKSVGVAVQITSAAPGVDGAIEYLVLRPDQHRTKLVRQESKTVTQERFNVLLQSGLFD